MSQYIVWYDSAETGAPVLNNAAGSLLAVVKACLVTGFNVKTVTITVAAGVATAACAGHGYSGTYGKDVDIAGATPAGLNGRKALTYVDTNTFKFAAPGIADGAATGTITARRSPLGWTEPFAGANKSIFKRSDVSAKSMILRLDDTNAGVATATDARAIMIESAIDIDTYTGVSPTQAGGYYVNKGANSATAKQWALVGSSKGFFLVTQSSGAFPSPMSKGEHLFFGDFASFKSGDAYNTLLSGSVTAYGGSAGDTRLGQSAPAVTPSLSIARGYPQTGGAVQSSSLGIGAINSGGAGNTIATSPVDSGQVLAPNLLLQETAPGIGIFSRGIMPGLLQVLAIMPYTHLQIIEPVVNLPGRKLLALNWAVGGNVAQVCVDMTGPWLEG